MSKMKRLGAFALALVMIIAVLPLGLSVEADAVSIDHAETYLSAIQEKRDGETIVDSYLIDFDGDGDDELLITTQRNSDVADYMPPQRSYEIWADGKLETQLEAMSRDVEEVLAECDVLTEEELADEEAEAVVAERITAEEELQLAFPKVQFIENPLPLPKKHVKKVMDFDYEIKDGMEDFDIEVAADDDFDL